MNALFESMRPNLLGQTNWNYSNYLTQHFPRRISGMGDDRKASEWVAEQFRSFGL